MTWGEKITFYVIAAYRQPYFSFYAMKGTFNPFPMNFII